MTLNSFSPKEPRGAEATRHQRGRQDRQVALSGPGPEPEQEHGAEPPARQKDLVATDAREQGTGARVLERGYVEVRVEGPNEAVSAQDALRHRPDEVQIVCELEPNPVGKTEVPDHTLLPYRLVGVAHTGKAKRDGHG
jgi:hypothetical protein